MSDCRFGETPTGTPRAGTPARGRRSSITFVEENSQLGNDLFGSQRFGGAGPAVRNPRLGRALTTLLIRQRVSRADVSRRADAPLQPQRDECGS